MLDRLAEIERRYEELERLVADPTVIANRREFAKLARERSQLEETVARWRERQHVAREIEEHRECLREKDAELRELARGTAGASRCCPRARPASAASRRSSRSWWGRAPSAGSSSRAACTACSACP